MNSTGLSESSNAYDRQHIEVVESPQQQEWRARQSFNLSAGVKAGLALGLFFFALPGGSPWTGAGFASTVMGHAVQWPWPLIAAAHFGFAVAYAVVIGTAIYRLRFIGALVTGGAIGTGLFAISFILLAPWTDKSLGPLTGHIIFGVFAAVAYKALAVQPPLTRRTTDTEEAARRMPVVGLSGEERKVARPSRRD